MVESSQDLRTMLVKGNGTNGNNGHSLEQRVALNLSSGDSVLVQTLSPSLQQGYSLQFSEPSSLSRTPIIQPSKLYLLDLLQIPADDYGRILEKIKQIRAINPESKVAILATEGHQTSPDFSLFLEAQKYGLVGLITRPDPSQSTEAEYASNLATMANQLLSFLVEYRKTNGKFENMEVIKIGGSIFDLYAQNPDALRNLLAAIVEIHKKHDLILTVGGGPLQAIPQDYRDSLGISPQRYEDSSRVQITEQALTVVDLLRQIDKNVVAYIPPEFVVAALRDGWITREFLQDKIPVFSYLPQESEQIGISRPPYYASDVHTVMFADKLGSRKVIFAKNTDGIYTRDPNLPTRFFDRLRAQFRGRPEFIDFIYAQNIQDQIERIGLNPRQEPTPEHLIETLAIQPFLQSGLYTIQVVNGTKPQQLADAMNGFKVGSYIIK